MASYKDEDEDSLLEDSDSLPPIWGPPTCFCEARHTEPIRGIVIPEQGWRMKDRVSPTFCPSSPIPGECGLSHYIA